jgi:hypothetical protein
MRPEKSSHAFFFGEFYTLCRWKCGPGLDVYLFRKIASKRLENLLGSNPDSGNIRMPHTARNVETLAVTEQIFSDSNKYNSGNSNNRECRQRNWPVHQSNDCGWEYLRGWVRIFGDVIWCRPSKFYRQQ